MRITELDIFGTGKKSMIAYEYLPATADTLDEPGDPEELEVLSISHGPDLMEILEIVEMTSIRAELLEKLLTEGRKKDYD